MITSFWLNYVLPVWAHWYSIIFVFRIWLNSDTSMGCAICILPREPSVRMKVAFWSDLIHQKDQIASVHISFNMHEDNNLIDATLCDANQLCHFIVTLYAKYTTIYSKTVFVAIKPQENRMIMCESLQKTLSSFIQLTNGCERRCFVVIFMFISILMQQLLLDNAWIADPFRSYFISGKFRNLFWRQFFVMISKWNLSFGLKILNQMSV